MPYGEEETLRRIISAQVIAVVGLSKDESKPSHEVAKYLLAHSKTIIPVNPTAEEILGRKCYKSLLEIPAEVAKTIEIVDVFRKPEDIQQIAQDAIELRRKNANRKPEIFWMQLGIENEAVARLLENAGFKVVMGHCAKIEHIRFSNSN